MVKDTNIQVAYEQAAWDIIEDFGLDYGNAELCTQDGNVIVTVEAPNNATISVWVEMNEDADHDELPELIKSEIASAMYGFDVDDEFTELWSAEFGKHNGFTPSQFLRMLTEDQEFFVETALSLAA